MITMFYHYGQNNSGGSFVYDEAAGLTIDVFIEADSAVEANDKAEKIGIYFNGCEDERDCECCGDRWSSVSESSYCKSDAPKLYGKPVSEMAPSTAADGLVCVHYADGRKEWFA